MALKRQLYGQPYVQTDLPKLVRILRLKPPVTRWERSCAYGQPETALFVPVVVTSQRTAVATKPAAASITIEIAGVMVRVERGVDAGWPAEGCVP